jgi:hypothetical protein
LNHLIGTGQDVLPDIAVQQVVGHALGRWIAIGQIIAVGAVKVASSSHRFSKYLKFMHGWNSILNILL